MAEAHDREFLELLGLPLDDVFESVDFALEILDEGVLLEVFLGEVGGLFLPVSSSEDFFAGHGCSFLTSAQRASTRSRASATVVPG